MERLFSNTRLAAILRRAITILLISGLTVLSAGCASSPAPKLGLWDHLLVDRIWDIKQQKFIDRTELIQQMLMTEYLLLGERHDNRVHHQHQAWVIRQLHQARRQASVAFEMIDDQQGSHLARQRITSVEQMISTLDQFRTSWDYEHRYKDLFAQVMVAGYPIIPANLNRQRLRHIMQQGEDKLPQAYQKMLAQVPLPAQQMHDLRQEIQSSHCNMLGEKATQNLILAQRVRDAVMAHSLTKSRTPMNVLIAGAGHVRNDRGVPLYLDAHAKSARVLTIGFTEVAAGANDISHYAERWGTDHLPFDIVWFTPQVERGDLCAQIRHHMEQKKN